MFSNPDNDALVMTAWECLLRGDLPAAPAPRPIVGGSWRRCLDLKVDPGRCGGPEPIAAGRLDALRQSNAELLDMAAPVLVDAHALLAGTDTMLALADVSGTILKLEGDTGTMGSAESIHLLPGVTWSEVICGTNAIGTALAVGEPVQIHSAEHYCEGIKRWTCSATVIRHPLDGEILGVVDVSGLSESYSRHSLALVVTTANRIAGRIAAREMELRYRLLDRAVPLLAASQRDGVMVFDRRGYPIKTNAGAQALAGGENWWRAGGGRIGALSFAGTPAPAGALPDWIDPDRVQPVLEGGERIGTLVTLPAPGGQRRPVGAGLSSWLGEAAALCRGDARDGDGRRGTGTTPARSAGAAPDPSDASAPADEATPAGFEHIVARDPAMREAVARASQLAAARVPVLLLGETGVGKEEFAQGIHRASAGRDGAFVAVNCGGLSRELLASELFGYAEGAFTGARRGGMVGKFEAANGGTLFLDELGEMPLDLQPHLLRVLERGEIHRLGENQPRRVSFRLVAATHRDLRREVAEGRFRMDLFYRVAVTSVQIPPLRARHADLHALVGHFLARFAREHGSGACRLDPAVLAALAAHDWPGNVRELRNVVEGLVLMARGPVIGPDALPPEWRAAVLGGADDRGGAATGPQRAGTEEPALAGTRLDAAECGAIRDMLVATQGNLTQAARRLGIAKSTLYAKLHKYGLDAGRATARGTGTDGAMP
ncbi:sigma-54-dependent Fis family transcriptional regulator [Derxia lacustris]|uniref:sigma-54-dependent Fis family transcriptional regulator n=1 Tax=Derxia lacustris TaxID=764842 RepID=UPI00111C1867|nr:sigma-54-dependent Fis family transcriptional regulator [Derxia lacustris]